MTPTSVAALPLTRMVLPTSARSEWKRDTQSRWLMIAAGGPFGCSSSAVKPRPEHRTQADHGKRIVDDESGEDTVGHVTARDVAVAHVERRRAANDRACRKSSYSSGDRTSMNCVSLDSFGNDRPDDEQPIGIGKRERMQHEAVDDAEDGRVAANAEREREDRNGGETRPPDELPACIPDILSKRIHRGAPVGKNRTRRAPLADGAGDQVCGHAAHVAHRAGGPAIPRLAALRGDRLQDLGAVAAPEFVAEGEQQQTPQPRHVRSARRRRGWARA